LGLSLDFSPLQMLALLFTIFADVFGRTSQITAEDAMEMSDLVDFLYPTMQTHCRPHSQALIIFRRI
jgi:hypothetical protein